MSGPPTSTAEPLLRVPQVSRGDERGQPGVCAGRAGPAQKRGGPRPAGGPLLPRDVRPELQADPGRAQVTRPDAPIVSWRLRMPPRVARPVTHREETVCLA